MKILLSAINAKYIHSNPAVYSLKAYATKQFALSGKDNFPENKIPEIIIKEHTINNLLDDILQDIYLEKPDLIGFSCYIWNISYVNLLIAELKKLLPHTPIWVGGPEVSYNPKEYLQNTNNSVTGVILGEGEDTFFLLADMYARKQPELITGINGIAYKKEAQIIVQPKAACMDINNIPFFYSDMSDFDNRIVYYETSRGCPFSCSYCLSSVDKQMRFRHLDKVEEELLFFLEHKVPQVKFIDRTFNCNPERAYHIWNFIHQNDNGITNFHFEVAGDMLTEEQLELFKTFRPGLIQLEIGVQTANAHTLAEINRKSDLKLLEKNVQSINKMGNIHQHLDLIAGLPMEDLNSFKESFNYVYSMAPNQLQLGFLKVLSGSQMKEKCEIYDLLYRTYPPYEVLSTKWLTHEDIITLKKVENVVEIFYNSHQFDNSISFLSDHFQTAFDLYYQLGEYYYSSFDTKAKHSRISRYNFLLDFYDNLCSKNPQEKEAFKQLLTLDVYLRECIKTRPDFSLNLDVYHENIINLKKKYNLPNRAHIEVFSDAGLIRYVYFDYDNRNPIHMSATLKELEL